MEKLLLDNEICGMAKRLVRGIGISADTLAVGLIKERGLGYSSEGYLGAEHTMNWFKSEILMPSEIIDRSTRREFEEAGEKDARQRAEVRIERILSDYEPREFDPDKKKELDAIILRHAQKYGMKKLPISEIS
jgi:trimethylamine--corrinoid protein Co-methyltransferase